MFLGTWGLNKRRILCELFSLIKSILPITVRALCWRNWLEIENYNHFHYEAPCINENSQKIYSAVFTRTHRWSFEHITEWAIISFMGLVFHSAWSSAEMTQLRSVQIVYPWIPHFLGMSASYSTGSLFASSALVLCSADTETPSHTYLAAFGPLHQGVWISRGGSVVTTAEVVQWSRALAAFPEDPGLIPSIHLVILNWL